MTEYILIEQSAYQIEHYVRQDNDSWNLTTMYHPSDTLHLPTIDCDLPLIDVYEDVRIATNGKSNHP
ncbi:MAG: hypothetical protein AAF639_10255 [Chloroflexota bacterium]